MNNYNTSTYYINGEYYCLFCNKKLNKITEWHGYDSEDFYPCDCELAVEEQKILQNLLDLKYKLKNIRQKAESENEFIRHTKEIQKRIDNLEASKREMTIKIDYHDPIA